MRNILIAFMIVVPAIASGGFSLYTISEETSVGTRSSDSLKKELHVVRDIRITAYVEGLTAKLANTLQSPFQYSVVVFERPTASGISTYPLVMPADYASTGLREPLSVAGGAIFVPLSMLADAPREEWFAFQIAHAMAHIASRHAARLESRREVALMPDGNGNHADPALMRPVLLSSSHKFELDADVRAIAALSDGGYDPNKVTPLGGLADLMAERRQQKLMDTIARLPKKEYRKAEDGFAGAKRAAAGEMQK